MNLKKELTRIEQIMGNKDMTHCLDCNKTYLAFTKQTEHTCPFCQADLLIDDDIEQVLEEVSHENLYL